MDLVLKVFGVCLASCIFLVVISGQHLNLSEGNTCKEINGTIWTCKNIKECPTITKNQTEGKENPRVCGQKGEDTYVCCEPEVKNMVRSFGKKAKEMCKKYGEAAFVVVEDFLGEHHTIDTCPQHSIPLIVGSNGENAKPREFPHMALIGYGEPSSIQWFCGGSLISDRYVLSAAHCTVSASGVARWVRLGDLNFRSRDDDANGDADSTEFEIVERINHPEHNPSSVYNDIALYKLNATVQFNKYIRPLCLNTEYEIPTSYDQAYTATGWGHLEWGGKQSDILQAVKMFVSPIQECRQSYNNTLGSKLKHGIQDTSMICAGDVARGRDTCPGDSGGPLQMLHKDVYCMYLQVGITSFGSLCGGNKPGVYTRVSHFIPWIESVVWP